MFVIYLKYFASQTLIGVYLLQPLPGPSEKLKIKAKDEKTKVIPPKKKQEQEKIKQEELKMEKENIKQEKLDQEKEKQLKKEQEKTKQLKIEKEKAKLVEQEKEKVETPEPVAPPGKKIIQPLTPRPAADDTVRLIISSK